MKQQSFASLTYQNKKVTTKREKFLNEMEQVVPWQRLVKLIEPHYKNKTKQKLEVKKTKKKNNSKGRKAMPIVIKFFAFLLVTTFLPVVFSSFTRAALATSPPCLAID